MSSEETEKERLISAANELLAEADHLAPTLERPPIHDLDNALDAIMTERGKKKGIRVSCRRRGGSALNRRRPASPQGDHDELG